MSCITCQSKFTFFTREYGCPNCGFSYCSKCLKYKCNLPSGEAKKVCGPCYNKLTMSGKGSSGESSSSENIIPSQRLQGEQPIAPLDIINKMEALENPVKPPIVIYKRRALDELKVGLEPADREILERLKKLKDEDKQPPPPSIDEIRRRLAILKDQDPDASQPSMNIHKTDTRTDREKEDDLIKECLDGLKLSSGSDLTEDVRARLDSLKGFDPNKNRSSASSESEDENAVTRKLIKRALEEARLEAKYQTDPDAIEVMEVEDLEDEAECCICEATEHLLKCEECGDELYCIRCLSENHDDMETEDHTPKPYKKGERKTNPD